MSNPLFRMMSSPIELVSHKDYPIPENATHVGVYGGKIAFFKSSHEGDYRGRKWKFFQLPPFTRTVSFRHYFGPQNGGGNNHHYGKPTFRG